MVLKNIFMKNEEEKVIIGKIYKLIIEVKKGEKI